MKLGVVRSDLSSALLCYDVLLVNKIMMEGTSLSFYTS